MTDTHLVVMALSLALILAVLWLSWRLARLSRDLRWLAEASPAALHVLQSEVQAVRSGVDERLREHVQQAQQLGQRLGWLEKATASVEQLGAGLEELQRILRPSQLRGAFGERLLEDLLVDVLPRDRFHLQYTYPTTGVRVDAAVRLGDDGILPIDAKFPLDNFRRHVELRQTGSAEAEAARRSFARDVRRHVDDIAERYLSADDGAAGVAFMYIPSEAVYHELAIYGLDGEGSSLADYAIHRRVIPVSPNTLHAYLSVVRMGLRGFRVQQNAREVLTRLTQLQSDVEQLRADLGTAIRQARHSLNTLMDAEAAVRRMEGRLASLGGVGVEAAAS